MSLGVNLLVALTKRVAQTLGEDTTSRFWKCITTKKSMRRPARR